MLLGLSLTSATSAIIVGNNLYNSRKIFLWKILNIRIMCGAKPRNACRSI